MKQAKVIYNSDFEILTGNSRAQAAVMVLAPGDKEGGARNRHRGADQWLYVASGNGVATIAGTEYRLGPGTLVLIEHGETHEINNDGDQPLETLNFYVPPAFGEDEETLPAGKN